MPADGATLRYVVYDILRDFKQANAQAEISAYQIVYWVLVHADRLRKQHIGKLDSGEYLSLFEVTVSVDADDRKYITIPTRIYDYDLDRGVASISFERGTNIGTGGQDLFLPGFTSQIFGRTTPGGAARLYYRTEETPSATNPYFYRVGDLIYLLGIELDAVATVEVSLYSALDPADTSLDIDQPFDFPQDLIPVLKRQILDLGLWVLNVPKDLINDGTDGQGQVQQKKFISVNDINEQT